MRLLLTGGAGFIGSHVATLLATTYPRYHVVVVDKLDYCSSKKNLERIISLPNVTFVKGDVRSFDLVTYVLNSEKIDVVMHFAAQSHVDNSFGNSYEFTRNNFEGTHALLEACRRATETKIKTFLHVSTDEVYGENLNDSNTEHESLLTPTNPYAAF